MKKRQILVLTGMGVGLVGSLVGAVLTNKMYKGNREAIQNGEIKDDKEIKKAKLKTGTTALGTTILAGLAIASGAGLAMNYVKNEKDEKNKDYGKYFVEPNKAYDNNYVSEVDEEMEDNEWLKALESGSDLIQEIEDKNIGDSIDEEINEFITDMNAEVEDLKEIKELEKNLVDLVDKAIEQL